MQCISNFMRGWEISPVDIGVLVIYLLIMAGIGYVCRKASSNVSDYVCMGNKGIWWL